MLLIGKAYDGKGAKVLPILAKLCEKYETMNDEDKAKVSTIPNEFIQIRIIFL